MAHKNAQKPAEERAKRRKAVLNWIERVGPFSIPTMQLAKDHNCKPITIYRDVDFFIKKLDFKKLDLIGKKVLHTTKKNIAAAEELRIDSDKKIRLGAITAVNQSAAEFTKLLAEYGYKEKAKEFLEHGGTVVIRERVRSNEEIKNERKEIIDKPGPEQKTRGDP